MSQQTKIPVDQIDPGSRARQDYKDIKALLQSINEHGQIQPIALIKKESITDWEEYDSEDLDEDKPYLILAGGRRLEAFKMGKIEEIEAKVFDKERDLIEIKKIELYENLDREDLEWSEEVKLKAEIHKLETEISEQSGDKQSIRQTANKLQVSHGNLSEDLKLADAMEILPQLRKHKKKSDAKKELKQMMKAIEDRDAVKKIKEEREGSDKETLHKKIAGCYKNIKYLEGMEKFDKQTVDFLELDPPLQIGFEDIDRYDHQSYGDVASDQYLPFMEQTLKEAHRVLKNNSWIIVWYPIEPWHQPLLELMQDIGFKTRGIPMIWDKTRGQTRAPNTNMGNTYEVAFYGRKGEAMLEKPGRKNIFQHKPVDKSKRFHPTEKPIELYMDILSTFCRKGAITITGFAGSGNMVLAAQNLDMNCTGFDTSSDWKNKFDLKVYDSVPPNYTSYR